MNEKIPDLKSKFEDPIVKANYVKNAIIENFRVNSKLVTIPELIYIASRIDCFKKSRIKSLTENERILYDIR